MVAEIQTKRRWAAGEGVCSGPKSLLRRLDPSTHSSSLHFSFTALPLAFPTGDAPGFVTLQAAGDSDSEEQQQVPQLPSRRGRMSHPGLPLPLSTLQHEPMCVGADLSAQS